MLSVSALAKVNLHLHVTGRREDYHELDSLTCFANYGDELTFEPAPDFEFSIIGRFSPYLSGEDNLATRLSTNSVVRAAYLFADRFHQSLKVKITLKKNLPPGSGIGGGSADAAACLKGLSKFFNLDPDEVSLQELALKIGSDVPVCLLSSPTLMQGIGELLLKAPRFPSLPALLIWPDQVVPTPVIYKNLNLSSFSPSVSFAPVYEHTEKFTDKLKTRTSNDLELTALKLFPVIGQAMESLDTSDGCLLSRMSGSGSTVFGLFESTRQAESAAAHISQVHPNWWVKNCILNKSE